MLLFSIFDSPNRTKARWGQMALSGVITSLALCIAMSVLPANISAEDGPPEQLPEWSITPAEAALLAPRVDGEWFSIQPPQGFERADLGDTEAFTQAGIKVAVWSHEADVALHPAISIMELPKLKSEIQSDQAFLKGMLDSLQARWPIAVCTPIKHGQWNGRRALRFEFSATTNDDAAVEGIVVANVGDFPTFVVSAMHIKDPAGNSESLTALTNSAISCRKK